MGKQGYMVRDGVACEECMERGKGRTASLFSSMDKKKKSHVK